MRERFRRISAMDTITHVAIGALVGEVTAGKSLGRKSMLIGALAQSFPDIDFLAVLWSTPAENLLAHRGFTHSLLFSLFSSVSLAFLAARWFKEKSFSITKWFLFFLIQAFIHLGVDVMNVYGTGLLEPFSHTRFSLNWMFVFDPMFSFPLIVIAIILLVRKEMQSRKKLAFIGLVICVVYIALAAGIKSYVNETVEKKISSTEHFRDRMVTPTPMNALLWYVVIKTDSGCLIGYRSVFDHDELVLQPVAQNKSLLEPFKGQKEIQQLERFSQGYYVITKENDQVIFNDIRFGQVFGWIDSKAPFVFQYHLQQPGMNTLALQRGRFSGWNAHNVAQTIKRIRGEY